VVPLQSSSCQSPDPVNPSLFLPRSRPWLLAKAAEGGLESAPASRLRGAYPHQSNSCAPPQPFGCLLCSWHTIVGIPYKCPQTRNGELPLSPKVSPSVYPFLAITARRVSFDLYSAKGISQQLIGITRRCDVFGSSLGIHSGALFLKRIIPRTSAQSDRSEQRSGRPRNPTMRGCQPFRQSSHPSIWYNT